LEGQESTDGRQAIADDPFFVFGDPYQLILMSQAGLLEVSDIADLATGLPVMASISFEGHDYLDAIRSETIWNKTREGASKLGGVTLGIIKDLAVAYIKQEAAYKLGITI
jgi:hypothetical protein